MRYEHQPRPNIEEHYHIRELIEAQEKRSEDRNYHRDRQKGRDERDALIRDAKWMEVLDFWCEDCPKDFKSMAVKQVEQDWNLPSQSIAFYRAKCDCGKWCQRLVTDKFSDPYWTRSRSVARDRGNHHADTVQPWETGFNMLYGKK